MPHTHCALCEGLDACRIMDCPEALPDGQEVCRHCEVAMADDFAAEDPADPFTRTPEPWGRPQHPLHDTRHLPQAKHTVRRRGLPTPTTRHHQRAGREHRCYAEGGEQEHGEDNQGPRSAHEGRDQQWTP
jgi:hypothetical protein